MEIVSIQNGLFQLTYFIILLTNNENRKGDSYRLILETLHEGNHVSYLIDTWADLELQQLTISKPIPAEGRPMLDGRKFNLDWWPTAPQWGLIQVNILLYIFS